MRLGNDASMHLDARRLDDLRLAAAEIGFARVGAVSLDDPGFAPAREELREHLDAGRHGQMAFMERTQEVRGDPRRMFPEARSVVVGLVPYAGTQSPVSRYAQGPDYHTVLHERLEGLQRVLGELLPGVESLPCVDTKPLLERTAAALAGLGFLGKHGCLIAPGLGSYVLIGALLVSATVDPFDERDPSTLRWDTCGVCTKCLDACPTDAFVSAGRLDARRCISYLTIEHRGPIEPALEARMGEWLAGCDVCQDVCPYNVSPARETRAPERAWLPGGPRGASGHVDLTAIAHLRSGRYRAFVKGSALRRIPRDALRRNALIALGNRVGPPSAEEREALETAQGDPDPVLADTARRAWQRRRGASS